MNRILAAPMVAVSTANARRLVRLVHEMPVLYTEMLVDKSFLGKWDAKTVVQIASNSAPDFLDACKRLYNDFGYASFNLNCGCPSTKIACSASSGAALMLNPELVSKIIMNAADSLPMCSFSLKCRTGIDYNDSFEFFKAFIAKIGPSDKISIDVHARKAWLQGLSPKQNRTIPPINYDFVYKIASVFPCTSFSINGDIKCVSEIEHHLQSFSGNIMIGRSLYDNPMILYALSLSLDKTPDQLKYQLINEKRVAVVKEYCRYVEQSMELLDGNTSVPNRLKNSNLLAPLMGIYSGTPVSSYFKHQLNTLLHPNNVNFSFSLGVHRNNNLSDLGLSQKLDLILSKTQKELKSLCFRPALS